MGGINQAVLRHIRRIQLSLKLFDWEFSTVRTFDFMIELCYKHALVFSFSL
jgi:hypothetical protein